MTAVAGALVDDASGLVFTSNRGEDTVGIFSVSDERRVDKVGVGRKPNGLSFDPSRRDRPVPSPLFASECALEPTRIYRRYAIVADSDLREAGTKLAAALGTAATGSLSDNSVTVPKRRSLNP